MAKFPVDARRDRVLKALGKMGFAIVRQREHISLERTNPDGSKTPLTLPNHPVIKSGTLRAVLRQSRIDRDEFLKVFDAC